MPNDSNSGRTQLLIAVIGLTGVLGAALFPNWDKIFPKSPQQTSPAGPTGNSASATPPVGTPESHPKKKGEPKPSPEAPPKTKDPVPERPKTYSIHGRLTDQFNGKLLCVGQVSAQIAGVHQVQRADTEGRYAFELEGFSPEDELILDARAPSYQDIRHSWKLSDLKPLENLEFTQRKKTGASMGAIIGGLAGGGKGAAIGSSARPAQPAVPACADASGPVPAYQPRPDASHLVKGSSSSYP